ncbi:Terpenoid synthase [Penicillium odoratum]|uniref:Terpenoid synthase n=1 Tax=Penicillium odoratum TaxID=1167516 RepID=UPI0025491D3D|nr:Terpenoid synthase [Penicillium odoratum]KAJ5758487.1 Terpenoid synthase [Penicillium odoratum]
MINITGDELIQQAGQVTRSEYEELLTEFFAAIPYQNDLPEIDPSVEEEIARHCLNTELTEKRAKACSNVGAGAAEWFYPTHKRETRVAIGIYTALCVAVDDFCGEHLQEVQNFRLNMVARKPQVKFLEALSRLLSSLDEHYEPFCSDKIITTSINYMGACVLEHHTTGKFEALKTASMFPHYLRLMTGIPEAYVFFILHKHIYNLDSLTPFIQALPDLVEFTNGINDLLSFYKESIVGVERNNYVYLQAMAQQDTALSVLHKIAGDVQDYIRKVKSTLEANGDLLEVVDAYIKGNIVFHIRLARYRLSELSIPSLAMPIN